MATKKYKKNAKSRRNVLRKTGKKHLKKTGKKHLKKTGKKIFRGGLDGILSSYDLKRFAEEDRAKEAAQNNMLRDNHMRLFMRDDYNKKTSGMPIPRYG